MCKDYKGKIGAQAASEVLPSKEIDLAEGLRCGIAWPAEVVAMECFTALIRPSHPTQTRTQTHTHTHLDWKVFSLSEMVTKTRAYLFLRKLKTH